MKRALLLVFIVIVAAAGYALHRAQTYLDAPVGEGPPVQFEVARGATAASVIDDLVARGLVKDRLVFELYARSRELGAGLQAGRHSLDPQKTPRALVDTLMGTGASTDVAVTLPEGLNKWEVADRLAAAGLVDRAAFLSEVDAKGLEGQLFPDTYRFEPGAGHEVVLARLTDRFRAVAAEVAGAEWATLQSDLTRWLTLASLVEAEAQTARDRGLVSRVFHNRLAAKMRLQTDPTCVYGPDTYTQKPSPALCKDPRSRYSTYVIPALPPTPISNPGRAALRAALRPADGPGTDKLLYFVAKRDGTGEHAFNATYAEHRAAVRKYLMKK